MITLNLLNRSWKNCSSFKQIWPGKSREVLYCLPAFQVARSHQQLKTTQITTVSKTPYNDITYVCMYSGTFFNSLCNGCLSIQYNANTSIIILSYMYMYVNVWIFSCYYVRMYMWTLGPTFHQCTVTAIESVTHDTQLFTLRQPSHMPLHVSTGQHIKIQAKVRGKFDARCCMYT